MESPQPKEKNWFQRHPVWTVVLALLAVFMIVGAASNNSQSTNTASSSTPTPTPAPAVSSTTQQVDAWFTKYGEPVSSILATDLGKLRSDANNENMAASSNDCQQVETEVTIAQSDPAIPDSSMEKNWSTGLASWESGAQDCVSGVAGMDTGLITQGGSEMQQGTTAIEAVAAEIKQLNQ